LPGSSTGLNILVIEDEKKIAHMVQGFLENEGFKVGVAHTGKEGLDLARQGYFHLVVLDLMLPDVNGLEVCRLLRRESELPVIMLTARSQEMDRVVGLEVGADDYITKPFSLAELSARIRAVLRRAGAASATVEENKLIVAGDISVDLEKHQVHVGEKEVFLTPTEFNILALMARHPRRVFSRLQLLENALGEVFSGYERSIDTHISNLRRKVEKDPSNPRHIATVFGLGYRFNP